MGAYKNHCPECGKKLGTIEKYVGRCVGCDAVWEDTPQCCRECGCTDKDCRQCIQAQGYPCGWAEQNLCTRCANEITQKEKAKAE